jgi:orotate phosphoribosyltransferase
MSEHERSQQKREVQDLARRIEENVDFDEYETVALITVATSATEYGDSLADILPVFHIPTRKDLDGELYIPERTQGLPCIFVDDIYTTGTTFEKVKRHIGGKLIAAFVLADRSGETDPTLSGGEKVYSVISGRNE